MNFPHPEILLCKTPTAWIDYAPTQRDILLIDHALCEKKAALAAIKLLYSYAHFDKILLNMAKLAREELKHFDMVIALMQTYNIPFKPIPPSSYAKDLHGLVRKDPAYKLLDLLILAAFIEARSYERFVALLPVLDPQISAFYKKLCISEMRHYKLYIDIAATYFTDKVQERVCVFAACEAELIERPDPLFRMHSGVPT